MPGKEKFKKVNSKLLIFFCLSLVWAACGHQLKYPYSISDFPIKHQPVLVSVVERGIVFYNDYIGENFSDAELTKLRKSDHPVLRATGLRCLLERRKDKTLALILSHLDDTATVQVDNGEFGIRGETVTDHIIFNARFKKKADRDSLIEIVLLNHNKLGAAYTVLDYVGLKQEYYPHIKEMAEREDQPFYDQGLALYGLARFGKEEDIPYIKDCLMFNYYELSSYSFKLMKEFPNESYLQVLENYFSRQFGFDIHARASGNAYELIETIVQYKSKESAILIERMINDLPGLVGPATKVHLYKQIAHGLWRNKCPEYMALLAKTKQYWLELEEKGKNNPITVEPALFDEFNKPRTWNWFQP